MNVFQEYRIITPIISLLLAPITVNGQAITVFGGGSSAKHCYMSAQIAAQMHMASRDEITECNIALEHGGLKARDLAATYVNRGIIYVALEEYRAAARDYGKAMAISPDSGAIYVNRGNLFFLGEIYDRAIDEYTKALSMELRADHVAHLNRGMAYEKLGKYVAAENDYRTALEIAPEWSLATSKLERVLGKMKKQPSVQPHNG